MDDASVRHEFSFEGKTYVAVHRDRRWCVIDGGLETTGPTLVDAMEAALGPLYSQELTRIAVDVLNRHNADPYGRGPKRP